MEYKIKTGALEKQITGCLVVTAQGGAALSKAAAELNRACGGTISKLLKRGDLGKSQGSALLVTAPDNIRAQRVLVLQAGKPAERDELKFGKLIKSAYASLKQSGARDALFYLDDALPQGRDLCWGVRQAITTLEDGHYRFDQFKSKPQDAPRLAKISFSLADKALRDKLNAAIDQGHAIAVGKHLAKDLGNLPGNVCTPTYLADQAKALAKSYKGLTTSVIEEKQMKELGMDSLLSVSAGSVEPAKLIIMNYKGGNKNDAPQVLVGKGITFDSGGISLKAGAAMDEMKYDMCGAASVFGAVKAAAELGLPINIIAIVAAAENMPAGNATKPGDIVTSLSGQTIEILNTDAEGRLVLCDALSYAEIFNPAAVIDVATLTGACMIALGHHASAIYANQQELANELLAAGEYTHDRGWQMPLWQEYQSQLDSNFADIANIGGRFAGSITAACFLARFTKEQRWAHMDIAGTAWQSGKAKGATGRPVALLTQYLLDRCADSSADADSESAE